MRLIYLRKNKQILQNESATVSVPIIPEGFPIFSKENIKILKGASIRVKLNLYPLKFIL
jgi:hypothetical protein